MFAASASFSIAASRVVGDSAASLAAPPAAAGPAQLFDPPHQRFHPLAIRVGIEIAAGKRRRVRGEHARERGGESLVERGGPIAIHAARGDLLLPSRAQRADSGQQFLGGAARDARRTLSRASRRRLRFVSAAAGDERFELGADRFARRDPLAARNLVALRVAR